MTDETDTFTKPGAENPNGNSKLFSVSIRGWLALMVIACVCAMSAGGADVKEPLYSISIAALSFYFGQNTKSK